MGAYGIQQEVPLLQRLLHFLPSCDLAFTTGYFCPTHELEVAVTAIAQRSGRPGSQVHILCAAPQVCLGYPSVPFLCLVMNSLCGCISFAPLEY